MKLIPKNISPSFHKVYFTLTQIEINHIRDRNGTTMPKYILKTGRGFWIEILVKIKTDKLNDKQLLEMLVKEKGSRNLQTDTSSELGNFLREYLFNNRGFTTEGPLRDVLETYIHEQWGIWWEGAS